MTDVSRSCPDSDSSPGDQAVTEEFRPDWDWVLVGSGQVIVARLDGRGSGFRGQRYFTETLNMPVTSSSCTF